MIIQKTVLDEHSLDYNYWVCDHHFVMRKVGRRRAVMR